MQIAIVKDNVIVQSGEHTELFPNIHFPVTGLEAQWMLDNDVHTVNYQRFYNPETEKLVPAELYIEDDVVFAVKVEVQTQEEIDGRIAQLANQIRTQRNNLLAQTDWTALSDTVISDTMKAQYETYRQALRDITLQAGFPKEVVWPSLGSTYDVLAASTMGTGAVV